MDSGRFELPDGWVTFEYCHTLARTFVLQNLVKKGCIAGVVGDAEEHLFTVVVSQVPSCHFYNIVPLAWLVQSHNLTSLPHEGVHAYL